MRKNACTFRVRLPPVAREDHPLHRRLEAARLLGGYGSAKELANELAARGYRIGERLIYAFESPTDKREPDEGQRQAIALACKLPTAFFDVDLNQLAHIRDLELRTGEAEARAVQAGREADAADRRLEEKARDYDERIIRLDRTLERLAQQVTPPADDEVPQPPGELGRRTEAPQTTAERPPQPETPPGVDRERSGGG